MQIDPNGMRIVAADKSWAWGGTQAAPNNCLGIGCIKAQVRVRSRTISVVCSSKLPLTSKGKAAISVTASVREAMMGW